MASRSPIGVNRTDDPAQRMEARLAITFQEAAELVSVSEKTIRRLVDQGELPVVKIGRAKRIAVKDLEQMLEDKKVVQRQAAYTDPLVAKKLDEMLGITKRKKK